MARRPGEGADPRVYVYAMTVQVCASLMLMDFYFGLGEQAGSDSGGSRVAPKRTSRTGTSRFEYAVRTVSGAFRGAVRRLERLSATTDALLDRTG